MANSVVAALTAQRRLLAGLESSAIGVLDRLDVNIHHWEKTNGDALSSAGKGCLAATCSIRWREPGL